MDGTDGRILFFSRTGRTDKNWVFKKDGTDGRIFLVRPKKIWTDGCFFSKDGTDGSVISEDGTVRTDPSVHLCTALIEKHIVFLYLRLSCEDNFQNNRLNSHSNVPQNNQRMFSMKIQQNHILFFISTFPGISTKKNFV